MERPFSGIGRKKPTPSSNAEQMGALFRCRDGTLNEIHKIQALFRAGKNIREARPGKGRALPYPNEVHHETT